MANSSMITGRKAEYVGTEAVRWEFVEVLMGLLHF